LPDARVVYVDAPVAVLVLGVLHFFPDRSAPGAVIARLRDAVPAGSFLALSHRVGQLRRRGAQNLKFVANGFALVAAVRYSRLSGGDIYAPTEVAAAQ
jgi:hypothetical protein